MQHKTVLSEYSATLNSRTVNRAISSANSKSATPHTETLKHLNINSEIRNSITLKQCNLK